ncbi:MAG: hypothetical protein K0U41_06415 [Gammaproteobacteria bacterium]|nr:hypothetical protein [Gammaproteobacteria bacterium]
MFITYQITHKISKKFYIGKTSLDHWNTGYMGSGQLIKHAVTKYGKDAFYRAILETFDNEEDSYHNEAIRVTQEEVDNPECYNLIVGGTGVGSGSDNPMYGNPGHWIGKKRPDVAERLKNLSTEDHPMYGKSGAWTGKKRPKHSKNMSGKNNH